MDEITVCWRHYEDHGVEYSEQFDDYDEAVSLYEDLIKRGNGNVKIQKTILSYKKKNK